MINDFSTSVAYIMQESEVAFPQVKSEHTKVEAINLLIFILKKNWFMFKENKNLKDKFPPISEDELYIGTDGKITAVFKNNKILYSPSGLGFTPVLKYRLIKTEEQDTGLIKRLTDLIKSGKISNNQKIML